MPSSRLIWIAAGIVGLACSCRPATAARPASTASLAGSGTWAAELTQSGGLLGVDLQVQVTSAGQLVASDRRTGRTVRSQVVESQIGELDKLCAAAISAQYPDSTSACADCYVYRLSLTSGDQSRTVRLDDVSMAGTAAEPLIAHLMRLRDAALAAS